MLFCCGLNFYAILTFRGFGLCIYDCLMYTMLFYSAVYVLFTLGWLGGIVVRFAWCARLLGILICAIFERRVSLCDFVWLFCYMVLLL